MSVTYDTPEVVKALASIDPELKEFLKEHPVPNRDLTDIPKLRQAGLAQEKARVLSFGPPPVTVEETTVNVAFRDGYIATHHVWKPKSQNPSGAPLVALFHGGGYCVSSPAQVTGLARQICERYGVVVVSLEYRLAPEHKFPTEQADAWGALNWAADNAESFGANPQAGFILGGISAGGNLTAVLAQKSMKDKLAYPLTGLWLCVPAVFTETQFELGTLDPKYKECYLAPTQVVDAPMLGKLEVDTFTAAYAPDWSSALSSPFQAENPHVGLPKAYFQICGLDPLRDDGLIYERVLKEHGVDTRLSVYPGFCHAQALFFPTLNGSKRMVADVVQNVGWLLGVKE